MVPTTGAVETSGSARSLHLTPACLLGCGNYVWLVSWVAATLIERRVAFRLRTWTLKPRDAFIILWRARKSSDIQSTTKCNICNSKVKLLELCALETWRTIESITNILQTFTNTCLFRIEQLNCYDKITNAELMERTKQTPMNKEARKRRCKVPDKTHIDNTSIIRESPVSKYIMQKELERGKHKRTWRGGVRQDMNDMGRTRRKEIVPEMNNIGRT